MLSQKCRKKLNDNNPKSDEKIAKDNLAFRPQKIFSSALLRTVNPGKTLSRL